MIQTSLRPCSPVDFGELLTIGGNCSFGNGVLVFDNISDYGFDPAPGKRLANILVKLRPDILVICMQGSLEFILDCSNPVLLQPGDMALFQQGQIVEFNETDQTAKLYVIAFPHDITLGINGIDTMGINGDGVLFRPSPKFRDKLINLYSLIRGYRQLSDTHPDGLSVEYHVGKGENLHKPFIQQPCTPRKNSVQSVYKAGKG